MKYISVTAFAKKWNLPERTVRNYCTTGKIKNTFLTGKTWNIPADAALPEKGNKKKFSNNALLNQLKEQKDMRLKGGIYHRTQIDLTYNSNRIEGSKLTQEQTRLFLKRIPSAFLSKGSTWMILLKQQTTFGALI